MTMSKTERDLLTNAANRPGGVMSAMIWYSTSAKAVIHGGRSADAIKSLVKRGLATELRTLSNVATHRDGYGSVHATEFIATITDAGRAEAIGHPLIDVLG